MRGSNNSVWGGGDTGGCQKPKGPHEQRLLRTEGEAQTRKEMQALTGKDANAHWHPDPGAHCQRDMGWKETWA